MHSVGLLIAVCSAAAFGLYPPAAKLAYADGANPAFLILLTTFARSIAFGAFAILRGIPVWPERGHRRAVVSSGFFQALSIFGIIGSLAYLPGPITIIIIFSHTIMLLLYLAYRGEMKLSRIAVGSTVLALFGLSMVLDVWNHASALPGIGLALAFGAAIATMSRLYVFGKEVQQVDPAAFGCQVFTVAGVISLLVCVVYPILPPGTAAGWWWSALCALSLVAGTLGMFFGIKILGAFQYSLTIKIEPVFTALFSIVLLGELLRPGQYFGIALVLASLAAYQVAEYRQKQSAPDNR